MGEDKIAPDAAEVAYGPHERNRLDVFCAKTSGPSPAVLFLHGGGFVGGDKAQVYDLLPLQELIDAGISVVTSNYRFSQHAIYPAPFEDCQKALQFVRSKSEEWGIDPDRMAVSGGSAGAGVAFWLAFLPDQADADSEDPILRASTRVKCVVTFAGQHSYDPRYISRIIGGNAHMHPVLPQLFGVDPEVWPELSEDEARLVEAGAGVNYVNADSPPALCFYNLEDRPVRSDDEFSFGIHHPGFGHDLKSKMEALGRECKVVVDPEMVSNGTIVKYREEIVEFFKKHLAG
jgi:acetyl esterase/lipase